MNQLGSFCSLPVFPPCLYKSILHTVAAQGLLKKPESNHIPSLVRILQGLSVLLIITTQSLITDCKAIYELFPLTSHPTIFPAHHLLQPHQLHTNLRAFALVIPLPGTVLPQMPPSSQPSLITPSNTVTATPSSVPLSSPNLRFMLLYSS